ncbi:MAG: hypothetical protein JXR48_09920 [Candidatus Delongbacteria bacterium]|nr:hypothetical protein [Candidatus Delongbacteria bacterium]MBN2835271.1 hypothetical protein [Candidatus Delongbacteria bacterium]
MNRLKTEIILCFVSLFLVILLFEFGKNSGWSIIVISGEIITLTTFLIFVFTSFFKSGLYKFTHQPLEKLDEREILIISYSLRHGYSCFSIVVLTILLIASVYEYSLSIVTIVSLIIIAHLMPAAIIGFCEGKIEDIID